MNTKSNFRVWDVWRQCFAEQTALGKKFVLPSKGSLNGFDEERGYLGPLLSGRYIVQFSTSKEDIKGKEIFTGDIIKVINNNIHTRKEYWNPVYLVEHDGFAFKFKHIGGGKSIDSIMFDVRYYSHKYIEVIGNEFIPIDGFIYKFESPQNKLIKK